MVRHTATSHPSLGLPTLLARFAPSPDSKWRGSSGVFSPGVLSIYPDVAPFPAAEGCSAGHGELTAIAGGAAVAVWDGEHWVV